ncbi:MAG: hypothetical protein KGJ13_08670 [Patescibacteria group bacterium]|nr:hypothetical protein [Patescibacteria group bacterium]
MFSLQPGTDNNAIRELRDEAKDLNKTIKAANRASTIFTVVLVAVGILQLAIAALRLAATIYGYGWKVFAAGLFLELVLLFTLFHFIKKTAGHNINILTFSRM